MSLPSQNAVRMWRTPDYSLPSEILSEIFLLVVEDQYDGNRARLMLVCRRWCAIMLSTPRVPSELRIRKSTTMEMVREAIQGTRWLLSVTIDMDKQGIGQDFNADAFDACFMAVIEAASRWQSLLIYSLPRPGERKESQTVPPLKNLEFFSLLQGCDLGSLFEPLMSAITTTTTSRLTNMNLHDLNVVLYLVQPDCLHVFCSLTTLIIWLSRRMEDPADILPHLQRIEVFHAWHLHLPIYSPDVPLPLTETLRNLFLKSVSVQWIAGRGLPVLRRCSIKFPHHIDTIRLQPVTMPACTDLTYGSNDLVPLRYFHDLPLTSLTVTSGQWSVRRGNLQLIAIGHTVVPYAQSLTRLDLQVRCSEQLLICMLSLLPALNGLSLRLANPHALNKTFFQAFVATSSNTDSPSEMGGRPSLPLCLKLVELEMNYKRWLRGPERTTLLLVFGDIVSSRRSEEDFQLRLNLDDLAQAWFVSRHVEGIREVENDELFVIGISSSHGIIPLEIFADDPLMEVPFKEAEYLVAGHQLSIGCFATLHHLVELRVGDEQDILPSALPPTLPLFHTLRVLEAGQIPPSFLAGRTFHKLERCRMSLYGEGPKPSRDQITQMPVCTRLDVEDVTLLATLKLPQICELGVSFDHPEFKMIWDTHIAVNANLSGLELLHVHGWCQQVDLIQVLRCLPVLKSLILAKGSDLAADFFGEFVPVHTNETAALMQSGNEGQMPVILSPMLKSLLIEECDLTKRPELIPILKQVVALRAVCGSPLKRFTLSAIEFGREFELIGIHGSFVAKMVFLDKNAKPFSLDI